MFIAIQQSFTQALSTPATRGLLIFVVTLMLAAPLVFEMLSISKKISRELRKEMYLRYASWLVLVPLLMLPILAGRQFAIASILLIALLCYREFARATGLFRKRALSVTVVLSILATFYACADHWYGFFVALPSLCVALTVIVALFDKSPNGYIQRVGLAFISILMFATCLGHYAYFANDARFQGIMLLVLLCVEINDVFAFACGKALGKHKLCPTISPNKTTEGFVGAILLTTTLFYFVGQHVFAGTPIDSPVHLLVMGALLSSIGQIGDLVMSSIKRDLNLKDMGQSIPGHGGLLDRFDSLIFVGPVLFHYVGYVAGVGLDQPTRLFTGG